MDKPLKRLSDEDIYIIKARWLSGGDKFVTATDRAIARKAEDELIKRVKEWGEEDCTHIKHRGLPKKRTCHICWQERFLPLPFGSAQDKQQGKQEEGE